MQSLFGFVVKADSLFYEGLSALVASIRHWHPINPIIVVDCGLTNQQKSNLSTLNGIEIIDGRDRGFVIPCEMLDYYTPSIYGFYAAHNQLFDTTVHIDADAVLCDSLTNVTEAFVEGHQRIAAVPDWPFLPLSFQIGSMPGALEEVRALIADLDTESISFNGGFFIVDKHYYEQNLNEWVSKLIPLHSKLWGNDQAILNLAAFAAAKDNPFYRLDFSFNARPRYRRDITIGPNKLIPTEPGLPPTLLGHFGRIRVLHFVGRQKPWHRNFPEDDSIIYWDYWRRQAKDVWKL